MNVDIASNEADLRTSTAAERGAKSLQPIDPAATAGSMAIVVQPVADPREPLHPRPRRQSHVDGKNHFGRIRIGRGARRPRAGLAVHIVARFRRCRLRLLGHFATRRSQFAPLLAIAAFVLGGLVVFPVLVLIAATAAALGPWMGFFSAGAGVLLSDSRCFRSAACWARRACSGCSGAGPRGFRAASSARGRAVAMIRMVPIAPFSIVNVVAGASKLSLRDFLLGTVLGMAPGIAVMAALGAQIADLARNASWTNAVLLALAITAWIALCLGVQFLVTWMAGRRT